MTLEAGLRSLICTAFSISRELFFCMAWTMTKDFYIIQLVSDLLTTILQWFDLVCRRSYYFSHVRFSRIR